MSDVVEGKGSCLCGGVGIVAKNMSRHIGACHCTTCRKWGGGPMLVVNCGSDVLFEGDDNISVYTSSAWAERGFCKQCGTHLYYFFKEGNLYFMPVGLFEENDNLVFDHQVFIDEKPGYYSFANETDNMTGDELVAKFTQ